LAATFDNNNDNKNNNNLVVVEKAENQQQTTANFYLLSHCTKGNDTKCEATHKAMASRPELETIRKSSKTSGRDANGIEYSTSTSVV
jgi:hypothetical protein